METIIVPLDGSKLAEQILPAATLLARLLSARVHLLRVIPDADSYPVVTDRAAFYRFGEPAATNYSQEHGTVDRFYHYAESYLHDHALHLESLGLTVTSEVSSGDPATLIGMCAAETPVAMIAMMTHGYSGIRRWTLGSIASRVVHAATQPVFLMRSGEHELSPDQPIKRILLPLDGSPFSRAAIPLAVDIARRTHAALTLLHVVTPVVSYYPELYVVPETLARELCADATASLEQLAGELQAAEVPITTTAVVGLTAEQIIDVAAQQQVHLIVMSTHGRSGIKRWALGSVTDKVLHASTTPLLLVRPDHE